MSVPLTGAGVSQRAVGKTICHFSRSLREYFAVYATYEFH